MPKGRQGIAASLITTIVNYSISLGIGIAGTVELHTNGGNVLAGYRGAFYTAIGLAGLGLSLAVFFLAWSYRR